MIPHCCEIFIYCLWTIYKMESGRMMLLHSVIIGVLLYLFLIFILGQNQIVAESRSILLGALILVYMILFGHGLPTSINKNLF
jgi:hypothetical protein